MILSRRRLLFMAPLVAAAAPILGKFAVLGRQIADLPYRLEPMTHSSSYVAWIQNAQGRTVAFLARDGTVIPWLSVGTDEGQVAVGRSAEFLSWLQHHPLPWPI
jgi:hypothetical protein